MTTEQGVLANRSRAASIMQRDGLEALVATTPENILYVSGSPATMTNWTMQTYALLPRNPNERPALIAPTIKLGTLAQDGLPDADLYLFGDFFMEGTPEGKPSSPDVDVFHQLLQQARAYPGPLEALAAALADRGLEQAKIGVDEMRIAPDILARLRDGRGPGKTVAGYKTFREIRLIKTPAELSRLRAVAQINEQAEWAITEMIAAGVYEQELADHFRLSVTKVGATPTNVTIGAGPRSAIPTIHRYSRQIEQGDLIRYDLGCEYGGYQADTGRTVVVGDPSDAQLRHFNAIYEGWERVLELIHPGAKASDIFGQTLGRVRESGIPHYHRHHVGHAIGLELYDDLLLGPGDDQVLEQGMTLCVETPYYELGLGGFQIEDTIVVTDTGFEFLTQLERRLFRR